VHGLDIAIAPRPRRILALLLVLAATVGAVACSDDDDSPDATANPGPDPDEVETSEVEIADVAFSPPAISVTAGNLVQWTNRDFLEDAAPDTSAADTTAADGTTPVTGPTPATEHTVTADDGSFDSGPLTGDATFTFTFETPGTYAYHCSIHSSMTGTVTVT
jgi:plastocyanin